MTISEERVIEAVAALGVEGDVVPRAPLGPHTSIRVGGPAAVLCFPRTLEDIRRLCRLARDLGVPLRVLGNGSNLLIASAGLPGITLCLKRHFRRIAVDGGHVTVEAGASMPALASHVARHGLSGLEFAIGIPGSVGGGLVTNAGTGDDTALGYRVLQVRVLSPIGAVRVMEPSDLAFSYRRSALFGSGAVVLDARFRLERGERAAIDALMARHKSYRLATQPLDLPNSGSVFKRPPGDYPGRLIEAAGCKGLRSGDAQISEKHANFIVNRGMAQDGDVSRLMETARARVRDRFGVTLEREIECWTGPRIGGNTGVAAVMEA